MGGSDERERAATATARRAGGRGGGRREAGGRWSERCNVLNKARTETTVLKFAITTGSADTEGEALGGRAWREGRAFGGFE